MEKSDPWSHYSWKQFFSAADYFLLKITVSFIREMQIKTIQDSILHLLDRQKRKKSDSTKSWQEHRTIKTLIYCWWVCELVYLLWKTIIWYTFSYKVEHMQTQVNCTLRYMPQRNTSTWVLGTIHKEGHNSKNWKPPKWWQGREWINYGVHTQEIKCSSKN